jgi:DNA-binding NarL/FixJ family response regulator
MKVLIIDNHDFILDSVRNVISSNGRFTSIETVNSPVKALETIKITSPDLIISDYKMPEMNGLELVLAVKENNVKSKIIILSMVDEAEVIQTLINQGINAYINKESSIANLAKAIDEVLEGNSFYCVHTQEVLKKYRQHSIQSTVFLSKRELEILKLIVSEFKNQDIAVKLNISVSTVETHKKNLIKKLNVKSVVGLVRYALEKQIFD